MMTQFYDLIDQIVEKQQELNIFIHKLKKIHGFKKGFQYDAATLHTISDGKETNVYVLIEEKLREIISLKLRLDDSTPMLDVLLKLGFDAGTRFDQWLSAQSRHSDHAKFDTLRQEILGGAAIKPASSSPFDAYLEKIHTCYTQLKIFQLYLERMQLSDNISRDNKTLLKPYEDDIKTLMRQIKGLGIETATADPESLAQLYQSKKFGNFYQNSVIMAEKFKSSIHPKLEDILKRSKDFSFHFSPSERDDRIILNNLISNIRVLPHIHKGLCDELGESYNAIKAINAANREVIVGQNMMQTKIINEKLEPSDLIKDLLDLDTVVPTQSVYKSWSASRRSGAIEVMLNAINSDRFFTLPTDSFVIQDCVAMYLGHSREFGAVNPEEFIGSELLKMNNKDLIFTVLAAISPIKTIKLGSNGSYNFTPWQKITAYATLIDAIDKGKLKIGKSSVLDQKRLLAERMLYLMCKFKIPATNPDVVMVKELISSGGGEKFGKAVRGLFSKKDKDNILIKTIQKLFREYDAKAPFALDSLKNRINGIKTAPLNATANPEVTTSPKQSKDTTETDLSSATPSPVETTPTPVEKMETPPLAGAGAGLPRPSSSSVDSTGEPDDTKPVPRASLTDIKDGIFASNKRNTEVTEAPTVDSTGEPDKTKPASRPFLSNITDGKSTLKKRHIEVTEAPTGTGAKLTKKPTNVGGLGDSIKSFDKGKLRSVSESSTSQKPKGSPFFESSLAQGVIGRRNYLKSDSDSESEPEWDQDEDNHLPKK